MHFRTAARASVVAFYEENIDALKTLYVMYERATNQVFNINLSTTKKSKISAKIVTQ